MRIIVTGGAGFIGSALVRHLVHDVGAEVLTLDKLTYAGTISSLRAVERAPNHRFLRADICDRRAVASAFDDFKPDRVYHLAAESHVDRSLDGPADFISTNIVGTYTLLECARQYWLGLDETSKAGFRSPSSMHSRASRCLSTETEQMCATGSTSRITRVRCI